MDAIRRVTHHQLLVPETWKLIVSKISEDASHFSFEVYGSKTGFDGCGEFDGARYVVIDYRDFNISWARTYSKKPCPEGFEVTWEAVPLFTDTIAASPDVDPSKVRLLTLAKGLSNGTHTLRSSPTATARFPSRVSWSTDRRCEKLKLR